MPGVYLVRVRPVALTPLHYMLHSQDIAYVATWQGVSDSRLRNTYPLVTITLH